MIVNCFTYMFSIVTTRSALLNLSTGLFLMSLENKYDISTKMSMDIHTAHERGKDKWSSLVPLTHHDLSDLGLICLVKKCKIRLRILSDLRTQSFFKETHPA